MALSNDPGHMTIDPVPKPAAPVDPGMGGGNIRDTRPTPVPKPAAPPAPVAPPPPAPTPAPPAPVASGSGSATAAPHLGGGPLGAPTNLGSEPTGSPAGIVGSAIERQPTPKPAAVPPPPPAPAAAPPPAAPPAVTPAPAAPPVPAGEGGLPTDRQIPPGEAPPNAAPPTTLPGTGQPTPAGPPASTVGGNMTPQPGQPVNETYVNGVATNTGIVNAALGSNGQRGIDQTLGVHQGGVMEQQNPALIASQKAIQAAMGLGSGGPKPAQGAAGGLPATGGAEPKPGAAVPQQGVVTVGDVKDASGKVTRPGVGLATDASGKQIVDLMPGFAQQDPVDATGKPVPRSATFPGAGDPGAVGPTGLPAGYENLPVFTGKGGVPQKMPVPSGDATYGWNGGSGSYGIYNPHVFDLVNKAASFGPLSPAAVELHKLYPGTEDDPNLGYNQAINYFRAGGGVGWQPSNPRDFGWTLSADNKTWSPPPGDKSGMVWTGNNFVPGNSTPTPWPSNQPPVSRPPPGPAQPPVGIINGASAQPQG